MRKVAAAIIAGGPARRLGGAVKPLHRDRRSGRRRPAAGGAAAAFRRVFAVANDPAPWAERAASRWSPIASRRRPAGWPRRGAGGGRGRRGRRLRGGRSAVSRTGAADRAARLVAEAPRRWRPVQAGAPSLCARATRPRLRAEVEARLAGGRLALHELLEEMRHRLAHGRRCWRRSIPTGSELRQPQHARRPSPRRRDRAPRAVRRRRARAAAPRSGWRRRDRRRRRRSSRRRPSSATITSSWPSRATSAIPCCRSSAICTAASTTGRSGCSSGGRSAAQASVAAVRAPRRSRCTPRLPSCSVSSCGRSGARARVAAGRRALMFLAPQNLAAALWFSATTDLLATVLVLASLLALVRGRRVVAAAAALAAFLSKESAFVLPSLSALILWLDGRRPGRRPRAAHPWLELAPQVALLAARPGRPAGVLHGWGGSGDARAGLAGTILQIYGGFAQTFTGRDVLPAPLAFARRDDDPRADRLRDRAAGEGGGSLGAVRLRRRGRGPAVRRRLGGRGALLLSAVGRDSAGPSPRRWPTWPARADRSRGGAAAGRRRAGGRARRTSFRTIGGWRPHAVRSPPASRRAPRLPRRRRDQGPRPRREGGSHDRGGRGARAQRRSRLVRHRPAALRASGLDPARRAAAAPQRRLRVRRRARRGARPPGRRAGPRRGAGPLPRSAVHPTAVACAAVR